MDINVTRFGFLVWLLSKRQIFFIWMVDERRDRRCEGVF